MPDFYVTLARNLTDDEGKRLHAAGMHYTAGVYSESGDPSIALGRVHVQYVESGDDAKRKVAEVLGLSDEEAARLTVTPAFKEPDASS